MLTIWVLIVFFEISDSYANIKNCEPDSFMSQLLLIAGAKIQQQKVDIYIFDETSPGSDKKLLFPNNLELLNISRETKILIPGWTETTEAPWVNDLKNAYLDLGHNVLLFDWDYYAFHPRAAIRTIAKDCGYYLGELLIPLTYITSIKLDLNKVHIIGHSVGAHIAGFVGKEVRKYHDVPIGRITGLDAAGDVFSSAPALQRLHATDAQFVDAVHNDVTFGLEEPYGSVDFYLSETVSETCMAPTNMTCGQIKEWLSCSRKAIFKAWIMSLISNITVGGKNLTDITFGEHCPRTATGIYKVPNDLTNRKPEWHKGLLKYLVGVVHEKRESFHKIIHKVLDRYM